MKIQKLKLIEPDEEELDMPSVKFSSVINLPATDFQKIIRDLSNISERLEIKSIGSELVFACVGPFATAQINRTESDGVTEFVKKTDDTEVIQGEFSEKICLISSNAIHLTLSSTILRCSSRMTYHLLLNILLQVSVKLNYVSLHYLQIKYKL